MYVKEQHIEVEQATQKIGANRTRKLFPEEIDWLLNKHQGRFIESRVTPKKDGSGGFEVKQFDIDAIQNIVVTGYEIPAYYADPRRYQAVLPGDYSYLLSDESVVKLAPVDLARKPAAPMQTILTNHVVLIPMRKSQLVTGPWYANVQVYLNTGLVFDMQSYTQARDVQFTGFNSKDEIWPVAACVLRALSDQGWKVYWERFGNGYYPKTFIVDTGTTAGTGSITIDGTTAVAATDTYSAKAIDYPQQSTQDQTNRLTASHIVQNLREVAFYRTQPESPLSEVSRGLLYTYANEYFTVTNNRISYVRKPRRISLSLGEDCELAPEYHQMICDLAVEYYKAIIADPNWEVKLKDNMVRTPL